MKTGLRHISNGSCCTGPFPLLSMPQRSDEALAEVGWSLQQPAFELLKGWNAQTSTLLTLQIKDTVNFSLLKRPRRGIIPQEVAEKASNDLEPTPAQEKVSLQGTL